MAPTGRSARPSHLLGLGQTGRGRESPLVVTLHAGRAPHGQVWPVLVVLVLGVFVFVLVVVLLLLLLVVVLVIQVERLGQRGQSGRGIALPGQRA